MRKGVRIKRQIKGAKARIKKRHGGASSMETLAVPLDSVPIIRADKFEEFMKISKENAITKKDLDKIQEITNGIVQRKRRRW